MKIIKLSQLIMAACMLVIGLTGTADAFHGGGVAHCDGCHSMHNSGDNEIEGSVTGTLLKGSDASSTCLNCHDGGGSYHIASADGSNVNQGGDFFWVVTDYTYPGEGGPETSFGRNRGHNIIAEDFGFLEDTTNTTAPLSTSNYPSEDLGCTSCHDAHGQVLDGTAGGQPPVSVSGSYGAADPTDGSIHGNYRLLGDSLYEAGDEDGDDFDFTYNAPVARSNGSSGTSVDYGAGMSLWCMNCHDDYLITPGRHVAGPTALLNGYGDNYNSYVSTGNFTGLQANAYDSLVPFAKGSVTDGSLLDETSTEGPGSGAVVMCLTCHRAHASAHNNAGRWDFETELIAESHVLESADVPASAVPYYQNGVAIDVAAVYGEWQRSLCNKCHVQD